MIDYNIISLSIILSSFIILFLIYEQVKMNNYYIDDFNIINQI